MASGNSPDAGRRGEVLAAALQCFVERGVEAATIQDICSRSGASVGSIYHHFGSKQGVVAALVAAGMRDNLAALKTALESAPNAKAAVDGIVASLFDWVESNPEWARFIYLRTAVPDADVTPVMAEVAQEWTSVVQNMWHTWVDAGELQPVKPEYFPSLLLGPLHDFARRWLTGQVAGKLSDHVEAFQAAAWSVVGKRTRPGPVKHPDSR
ncbi:TetR/AcrR family transcriptional regulator [Streptomyces sp. NPDC051776]|uniref:TetR/AcrR family transcriptional regulator n=1 Tax=Streptomyces sp. NPDC051776 TaxID=3155414 RepID=UPI003413F7FD